MTCGIYRIETRSGSFYIGSSYNCERRCGNHIRALTKGKHLNRKLQRSFDKNGGASWQVLFVVCKKDLLFFEQRAIDGLHPNLNINLKATGNDYWKGKKRPEINKFWHSKEANAKRKATMKGKPPNNSFPKGNPGGRLRHNFRHSDKTKAQMSASKLGNTNMLGKKHSKATKDKISAALMCNKNRSKISILEGTE